MTRYKSLQNNYPIKSSEPISEWIKRVAEAEDLSIRTIQRIVKEGSSNYQQSFLEDMDAILSPIQEHKLAVSSSFRNNKNMWVVISDVHIPAENIELMLNLLKFLKDNKNQIKGLVIAGDFLDCYGFSTHNINQVQPEGYSIELEYQVGNKYLDEFDEILPNARKIWLGGNHDSDRYHRYFKNVNTSVLKEITPSPVQALKLSERGYTVFENWKEDVFYINDLGITHGIYCGVNPVKSHLSKMETSLLFGHTHHISSVYEGKYFGHNIGWMGNIDHPFFKFASVFERAKWKNGFAIVHELPGNKTQVTQITCQDNAFNFGGTYYG